MFAIPGPLEKHNKVHFALTNESIESVLEALSPSPDDTIVSICGSGDIPFALAATGARVLALDIYSAQIEYAEDRMRSLRFGDINGFLDVKGLRLSSKQIAFKQMRDEYFLQGDRIERVRSGLDNIEFMARDIFDEVPVREPSIYYLSNALHAIYVENARQSLENIAQKLTGKKLIYLAGGEREGMLPDSFSEDVCRSKLARNHNYTGWEPSVYRVL